MLQSAAGSAGRRHCLVGLLLMYNEYEFVCIKAKLCSSSYENFLHVIGGGPTKPAMRPMLTPYSVTKI